MGVPGSSCFGRVSFEGEAFIGHAPWAVPGSGCFGRVSLKKKAVFVGYTMWARQAEAAWGNFRSRGKLSLVTPRGPCLARAALCEFHVTPRGRANLKLLGVSFVPGGSFFWSRLVGRAGLGLLWASFVRGEGLFFFWSHFVGAPGSS